ncbi:MAG: SO_0444 family Cu/Zn efflux transporter [Muribaculaceae bacterium]|nr:SO_0444 family Cu/Zn efflux transporter [Muribaculaceae bacterium]
MTYINAFLMMLHAMSPYLMLGFFIAGLLHAFVPTSIYSRYLSGTGLRSVGTAALFGIPLPLCSCGVLPTTVSLRRSGASRSASTSFLIATPQTGVDSIAATFSMLGLPFAILRPVAALVTALAGGLTVGALERRGALPDAAQDGSYEFNSVKPGFKAKAVETLRYGFFEMMQNIGRWLVLGLVIATLITVLVPDDFFQTYAQYPILNMVVILMVAVPMYVCATGSIPIAAALMLKGLSPGCALVLLMAGPAANLASVLVISQSFGRKATVTYLASIIVGAMGFGLLVDYWPGLREAFVAAMPHHYDAMHHATSVSWLNWVCSGLLLACLTMALTAKYWKSYQLKKDNKTMVKKEFKVKGMMCNHCKAAVENGLTKLDGVTAVTVDLAQGIAYVEGDVTDEAVRERITELGYENG